MLKKITFIDDQMTPETWVVVETDDIERTLRERYETFPDFARIYEKQICVPCDITPQTQEDIDRLLASEGPLFVVLKPGELTTIAYLIIAAVVVVAVATMKPKSQTPTVASRNNFQQSSPNNSLSGRTNQVRLNGRIPDIYGTVNSTPDLAAMPYTVFKNHLEHEYCFMVIGRGRYFFGGVPRIRDGQTDVGDIEGSTVEIYYPNTSPNTGDAPQLRIGTAIDRPVISARRSKSVNGQVLKATNESLTTYTHKIRFETPNLIRASGSGEGIDWRTDFAPGDSISIATATFGLITYIGNTFDQLPFQGSYSCRFNSDGRIEFADISDIGGPDKLLGFNGYGYITISDAVFDDGAEILNFNGKFVLTGGGNTAYILNPAYSSPDLPRIPTAYGDVWTSFKTVTFVQGGFRFFDFTGVYEVAAVSQFTITLKNDTASETPAFVNTSWNFLGCLAPDLEGFTVQQLINGLPDDAFGSPPDEYTALGKTSDFTGWIGPFTLDVTSMTDLICNFVAVNGMYKDDGDTQTATSVDIQVGATPVNAAGDATGAEQLFSVTVTGSADTRDQRAATLFGACAAGASRYKVRARRVTPKDLTFHGQISDEVKWSHLYSSSPVGPIAFGDVTTVHSLTQATPAALSVTERQLNMLVQRQINDWNGTTLNEGSFVATNDAGLILANICVDPKLGRMPLAEVNVNQILATADAVEAYFGNNKAREFNYTFDSDNMSPEEMISAVARTIFCEAHRRGAVLELVPEFLNPDSRLLFNHRNKIPGSENRTVNFGNIDDNDGIELQYVSPIDDAIVTFHVPPDQSAVKPKKIETIGIRGIEQAHLHAYREYNKLRFRNTLVQFEATQEANDLAITDRILVADNTRPDVQDGNIEWVEGSELKLSQPVKMITGAQYVIFLQFPSGIVQSFPITPGVDAYHVNLIGTPSETIMTADDRVAKCVYLIVQAQDTTKDAFLVETKAYGGNGNFTAKITASNYDPRYYQNDQDFSGPACDCSHVAWQTGFEGVSESLFPMVRGSVSGTIDTPGYLSTTAPLYGTQSLKVGLYPYEEFNFTSPAVVVDNAWTVNFSLNAPADAFQASAIDLLRIFDPIGTPVLTVSVQQYGYTQMRFVITYWPTELTITTTPVDYAVTYNMEISASNTQLLVFTNGALLDVGNLGLENILTGIGRIDWLHSGTNNNNSVYYLDEIRVSNIVEHTDDYIVALPFCECAPLPPAP